LLAIALAAACASGLAGTPLLAQSGDEAGQKEFHVRQAPSTVRLDGRLDDAVWQTAEFRSDFRQKDPVEGGEPTVRTEVAFLYDEDALYVGARMHDPAPARLRRAVTRRDQYGDGEHLVISLDTYRDRRTAYSFVVTAGGVRIDYYHPGDEEGYRDYSWDPVWEAETSVDSSGWVAEVRIPFSQLRFTSTGAQQWGVQLNRWIPSRTEDIYWVVVPKNETGWASRMGALTGIGGVRPSRRIELLPYVASDARFAPAQAGNPFDDGSHVGGRAGADLKMGLGPNLTLDATINPDFGQVEADPAVVNLGAFETFFDERRPFFTEGAQLLAGDGPGYFYSRRVGAEPHGFAGGDGVDYVDRPSNTTILGAAKVTGRLRSGLSVGALAAATGREHARTYDASLDAFGRTVVEPLTGYGVVRLQQELGANASTVGIAATATERDLDDPGLAAILNRRAFTGGIDFNLRTQGGAFELGGFAGLSHIAGSADAILRQQLSSRRFYQRPDQDYVALDPTRTSLTGWAAGLEAAKNAGTHWLWDGGVSLESPGFELNDAGQLASADDIDAYFNLRWRETRPGSVFRRFSIGSFNSSAWNFGGTRTNTRLAASIDATLLNFWNVFLGTAHTLAAQSDILTRGGPLMEVAPTHGLDFSLSSAPGRSITWRTSSWYYWDDLGGWDYSVSGGVQLRPSARVQLSVDPTYSRALDPRQYVTTLTRAAGDAATFGERYVFGTLRRSTLSARIRMNYAFTPDLSLELYAEPFVSTGRLSELGELAEARSRALRVYGTEGTTISGSTDDGFTVTDARAGGETFEVSDTRSTPGGALAFDVLSFRSNLVLRWEWLRGSTLFLVWQQNRDDFERRGRNASFGGLGDAFGAPGTNYLAVKATYWLPVR
jgi:hypothetical protein